MYIFSRVFEIVVCVCVQGDYRVAWFRRVKRLLVWALKDVFLFTIHTHKWEEEEEEEMCVEGEEAGGSRVLSPDTTSLGTFNSPDLSLGAFNSPDISLGAVSGLVRSGSLSHKGGNSQEMSADGVTFLDGTPSTSQGETPMTSVTLTPQQFETPLSSSTHTLVNPADLQAGNAPGAQTSKGGPGSPLHPTTNQEQQVTMANAPGDKGGGGRKSSPPPGFNPVTNRPPSPPNPHQQQTAPAVNYAEKVRSGRKSPTSTSNKRAREKESKKAPKVEEKKVEGGCV
jgi:hypothetical protein